MTKMATSSRIERLAMRFGIGGGSRRIGRTTLVRMSAYYGAVLLIVAGLIVLTDNMRGMRVTGGTHGKHAGAAASAALAAQPASDTAELNGALLDPLFRSLPPLGTGAAAVIAAFLLALPVAFTYVRTRNRLKYDESLVQTVIMLPVVVTSILIVVENSLALAFSLAGIVAAVRFRNNLKDSRDAVYVFAAVGIGFASGVGALAIAAFLSVFFCALELLLWKMDLAADHERTFGLLCMPARIGALAKADGAVIEVSPGVDANAFAPSADTGLLALGSGEPAPGNGVEKRPPERLVVYCSDPEKARPVVDAILGNMAKSYKLKKSNGVHGRYLMEYRVRPRKKTPVPAILDRLHAEGMPYVIAAEIMTIEEGTGSGHGAGATGGDRPSRAPPATR